MDPFETAVDFVLSAEGGLVDDGSDPGGITKFGISQRAYPDLNIRDLTIDGAKAIYREDYWNLCSCDKLPAGVALVVFDAAVNQGVGASIRMLQSALKVGKMEWSARLRYRLSGLKRPSIIAEMIARRSVAYALSTLVSRDGLGWFRRLAKVHQLALLYTSPS
jgi:lysozyme family protein